MIVGDLKITQFIDPSPLHGIVRLSIKHILPRRAEKFNLVTLDWIVSKKIEMQNARVSAVV